MPSRTTLYPALTIVKGPARSSPTAYDPDAAPLDLGRTICSLRPAVSPLVPTSGSEHRGHAPTVDDMAELYETTPHFEHT